MELAVISLQVLWLIFEAFTGSKFVSSCAWRYWRIFADEAITSAPRNDNLTLPPGSDHRPTSPPRDKHKTSRFSTAWHRHRAHVHPSRRSRGIISYQKVLPAWTRQRPTPFHMSTTHLYADQEALNKGQSRASCKPRNRNLNTQAIDQSGRNEIRSS